jgi:4'-phosphopantetheinyl transferase
MSPNNDKVTLSAWSPGKLLAQRRSLELGHSMVDLWAFELEGAPELVKACRQLLSPMECQRADRFVFARDQVRYTIAHGVLRSLLGRYCAAAPETLRFEMTAAGKPSLLTPGPHFNLSHSEDRALLAVSGSFEVGVDLERVRSNIDALAISQHYFFGAEREAIDAAATTMREEIFFHYWTAKEAVLKAQGIGLGFPLDRFCIRFAADGATAEVQTLDPVRLHADWRVKTLPCDPGWAAAVVARGSGWETRLVTDSSDL